MSFGAKTLETNTELSHARKRRNNGTNLFTMVSLLSLIEKRECLLLTAADLGTWLSGFAMSSTHLTHCLQTLIPSTARVPAFMGCQKPLKSPKSGKRICGGRN